MIASPSETRADRRRAHTRAALIDAARQVMAHKGVDATSLRDIAAAADLGLGTFYNHFESKEQIVDVIVDEAIERLGQGLDHLTAAMDDPAEVFCVSFRHTLRSATRDPIWGFFVVRVERAGDKLAEHLGHRVQRDVRRGQARGRFRRVKLRALGIALQGMLVSGMRAQLKGKFKPADEQELTAYTLELLGVDADEARALAARPLPQVPADGFGPAGLATGAGGR